MRPICDLWSIIKVIIVPNDNADEIWQGAIKKVVATYGVLAVLFLIRVRRRRHENLIPWLRNAAALSTVHVYPLLRYSKLLSTQGKWAHQLVWSIVITTAIKFCAGVPNWLSSYLTVEVCYEYVTNQSPLRHILESLEESKLIRIRQFLFCALAPALYTKPIGRRLFSKSSPVRDFAIFYAIWNIVSMLQYWKKIILKRRNVEKPRKRGIMLPRDEWPLVSTSLKPLMDKLMELQELATSQQRYTILETIMDSSLIKNIGPCLRWAIWRQFCDRVLSQIKLSGTQIMKSLVLMLGFLVLDHNGRMDIPLELLKYLMRYQLKDYLEEGNNLKKNWLIFASSNLALYTVQS